MRIFLLLLYFLFYSSVIHSSQHPKEKTVLSEKSNLLPQNKKLSPWAKLVTQRLKDWKEAKERREKIK